MVPRSSTASSCANHTVHPAPAFGRSAGRGRWLAGRAPGRRTFALIGAAAILVGATAAWAQAQPSILADGNAVVTGFSGAPAPVSIAPGVTQLDKTYIDVNGVTVRVIDLQAPAAPPQAQVLTVPRPFTATAAQTGQVFGLALDNALPPNIYVVASSAYGLPIVVPDKDADGVADRVKVGTPGASFMPGLFGPAPGGPGSIWRIDGVSGAVGLFANVTLDNAANHGPALGGVAFDPASNTLFVADRETGMIHRFGLDGAERGRFDHGVQGRAAAGLAPVAFDSSKRLNIQSPQFNSEKPGTWGYAPRARLVFGLAVHRGRLYYGVAEGLQVWSVAITADGFGSDARLEVTVPPGAGPTEISKITFDESGRMLLAERAAPTGDYALVALAQEGIGRVLRYAPVPAAEPNGPRWQPVPDRYAIGFPLQMTNANGGVAIGYRYDANGVIDRSSCGGFLWSTGEQLRVSADPAIAARLAPGGPAVVNGVQGNDGDLVAPANVPPWTSYFVDNDDRFDDPAARGQVGDIAIPRACERIGALLPGLRRLFPRLVLPSVGVVPLVPPPVPMCPVPAPNGCVCPPGDPTCACPPGTAQQPGLQCCPIFMAPSANGQCASPCSNGAADLMSRAICWEGFAPVPDPNQIDPTQLVCWNGSQPIKDPQNPNSVGDCPMPPNVQCPAGMIKVPPKHDGHDLWSDATCEQTPQQLACPQPGPNGGIMQVGLDGQCHELCGDQQWALPIQQCCPIGTLPGFDGKCAPPPPPSSCPPAQLTASGVCCPPGQKPQPDGTCGPPQQGGCPPEQLTPNGVCCPAGSKPQPNGTCEPPTHLNGCPAEQLTPSGVCCPAGSKPQPDGTCAPPPPPSTCPPGTISLPDGQCGTPIHQGDCPPEQLAPNGVCCPAGSKPQPNGTCEPPPPIACPPGTTVNPLTGQCAPQTACPADTVQNPNGQCCPPPGVVAAPACTCPAGQTYDGKKCVTAAAPAACATGYVKLPNGSCCLAGQATAGGQCCPAGQKPDANGRNCVPVTGITPPKIVVPPKAVVPGVVTPPQKKVVTPPPTRRVTLPTKRLTPPTRRATRPPVTRETPPPRGIITPRRPLVPHGPLPRITRPVPGAGTFAPR